MGQPTVQGARCPSCCAAVRPGAPWCTQCYARLGDAAPEPAADAPEVLPAAQRPEPAAAGASWPCSACDARNDLADEVCAGCGAGFLAAVRGERPSLVLPVVGDVTVLPPARRVAVAVALLIALLVVTALLGLLLA